MYTTIINIMAILSLLIIPPSMLSVRSEPEQQPQSLTNCLLWSANLGVEIGDLHTRFAELVTVDPNATTKASDDFIREFKENGKEVDKFNIECAYSGLNIPKIPRSSSGITSCDDKGIECIKEEIKSDCETYPELSSIDCENISRCLDLPPIEGGREVIECIKVYRLANNNECSEWYYNLAIRLAFLHNRFYEFSFVDPIVEAGEKDNLVRVFKENTGEVDRFNIECADAGFNIPKY